MQSLRSWTKSVSTLTGLVLAVAVLAMPTAAQQTRDAFVPNGVQVVETEEGVVVAVDSTGAYVFENWAEYFGSEFFTRNDMQCGQPRLPLTFDPAVLDGSTSDCSSSFTNPAGEYAPSGGEVYQIPVVWHVITANSGAGFVSDNSIFQQMDVLNEDFRALAGSLGGNGTDTNVEFFLATVDPDGNPTTGITRHTKTKWYNDSGNYWSSIGWDTNRYLNIYTNTAGGNLGYAYVPSGGGVVGQAWEGVRMYWAAVGNPGPIGHPYDLGRTTTHEVGHWLGLYHTFDGGCASASGCASNGDLICDTNPESSPMGSGSCSRVTCSSPDPTNNYMDYSDDLCMTEFTEDQSRRMRCTIANFRVDITGDPPVGNEPPTVTISSPSNGTSVDEGTALTFSGTASDAEDGSLSSSISWSSNLDGSLGSGSSVNATLGVGTHTVTASVTDSGGAGDTDTVSVTVNSVGGGGITLSGNIYKQQGRIYVDLTWGGANGGNVEIFRDGSTLTTTANDGFYTDATGQKGHATFTYQVCETVGGACSATITVSI